MKTKKKIVTNNPEETEKVAKDLVAKFEELGIDALIAIGGDLKRFTF